MPMPRAAEPLALPSERASAGFTFVEVLVAAVISTLLILGVLAVFDTNARISRVQSDVAEMQQAQRIAQHDLVRIIQMAGRGGLLSGTLPAGLALELRNNVGTDEHVDPADDTTPMVLAGTDVLTVRGVLTSPIYQVDYRNGGNFVFETGDPATSAYVDITLTNPSNTSIPQDLTPLVEAVQAERPEPLIIVSPLSDQRYAVVELDPAGSNVGGAPASVTVRAFLNDGASSALYHALTPGGTYPANLLSVAYVGILEEYRYYVRERTVGDERLPTLARARVYPGTDEPHGGSAANWEEEIADNIFDLQLTYGVDGGIDGTAGTANDGIIADGNLAAEDGVDPDADEWLYNAADDDDADLKWNDGQLFYLRLTTLVRSARRDFKYAAPLLTTVEDHDYDDSDFNEGEELTYRRRPLQTVIDMRNLG